MQQRAIASSRRLFLIGWSAILLVLGGLFAWSVLAPFEGAVITSGAIAVDGNHKAVQHPDGGIVSDILVREGDLVEAGSVMLSLDDAELESALSAASVQLYDLVAKEARLTAERDNATVMQVMTAIDPMNDQDGLIAAMNAQRQFFQARRSTNSTKLSLLSQRVTESEERIQGLRADVVAKTKQSALIEEELEDLRGLLSSGLVAKSRLLALERENERLIGERNLREAQISEIQVQIGETKLEMLGLKEGFQEDVAAELATVKTEIAELQERRTSLIIKLRRLHIVAPEHGRVLGVTAHTIGGVIPPTEPVMFIVPQNEALIVRVRILPQDIDKVFEGQQATLRFSSFNLNQVPEVEGKILRVSADVLADPATGMPYYEGIVALPDEFVLSETLQIVPGMPVDALLKTEQRTVLSYLMRPAQDAMTKTFRD